MTLTLITQHKPIERSTDMVFMTKKSQIQAWLNDGSTGNKILWQNVTLAKLYCGKIRIWQNDILAKSYLGKMILWQNNILAKSYLGIHIDTTAPYCSLRQGWCKIDLRFIITGAGTPGRRRA